MKKTTVVHCKIESFDVYIGRPSIWGNPFSHKEGTLAQYKTATLEESINKYREWIYAQPHLLELIPLLRGKTLGCWCKTPKNPNALCHGDVLVELVEKE